MKHGPMKRIFDISIASIMLLAVLPLMMFFAVLLKADSEGPVIYEQKRVGINTRKKDRRWIPGRRAIRSTDARRQLERRGNEAPGREFTIYKFRTMVASAEKSGPTWCQEEDPRVTRFGRLLRKTHLDELPQLINVLRGEMSIVGPRPERPEFVATLNERIPRYSERLQVKPGLTGLAQIRHRADLAVDDVRKKIRYDALYMKKASLATDAKIVLGTVPLVFGLPVDRMRRRFRPHGFSPRKVLDVVRNPRTVV